MLENGREAMLHFVYNSQVVSVLVCHDINQGEFVLQYPFFPPVEHIQDYKDSRSKCEKLILDSLIGDFTGSFGRAALKEDMELIQVN
jgi:hypothetical protein